MAWLRVYEWEDLSWPEFQEICLSTRQGVKLLKKLTRHFKVPHAHVFYDARTRGKYEDGYGAIHLPPNRFLTLGLVCHEFAHHLAACRWGRQQGHNKKFRRELRRVYTFARRYLPEEKSLPGVAKPRCL